MPVVRQNRPEQASTACHTSSIRCVTVSGRDAVVLAMALLSFRESTPGTYRFEVGNAALPFNIQRDIAFAPGLRAFVRLR